MAFDPDAPSNPLDNSGTLMLIGGAEDKVGHRSVLRRFVALAGGPTARLAIVATASEIHDLVAATYHRIFTDLGVGDVRIIPLYSREACDDEVLLTTLNDVTGLFLTGGNQLKLMITLGGTRAATRIRRLYRYGCVIAGTSAGASAVCQHMMAYGDSGVSPRKAMMHFSPGLGLISRLLVDQHFGARGRTGRLITALAYNPYLVGVGLDEDTAIEVDAKLLLRVFGRGSVMVVDGADTTYSDLHRLPDNAPLSIFNLRVHLLTHGHTFDIATRTPLIPAFPPQPFEPLAFANGDGI